MDKLQMYYKCPICGCLLREDLHYALHLKEKHEDELIKEDKRLNDVPETVWKIIVELLIKELREVEKICG
ncbi:hypothetical protein ES702_05050 [subsurface metagenome]